MRLGLRIGRRRWALPTALDRRLLMETIGSMEPNAIQPAGTVTAKTVAAIDVGANALRMVIAEVFSDGRIEVLEQLQRAVRLGQDTFRRGRLGGESMRAAVQSAPRLPPIARSLQGREDSRRGHHRRPRGQPTATRFSTASSWPRG